MPVGAWKREGIKGCGFRWMGQWGKSDRIWGRKAQNILYEKNLSSVLIFKKAVPASLVTRPKLFSLMSSSKVIHVDNYYYLPSIRSQIFCTRHFGWFLCHVTPFIFNPYYFIKIKFQNIASHLIMYYIYWILTLMLYNVEVKVFSLVLWFCLPLKTKYRSILSIWFIMPWTKVRAYYSIQYILWLVLWCIGKTGLKNCEKSQLQKSPFSTLLHCVVTVPCEVRPYCDRKKGSYDVERTLDAAEGSRARQGPLPCHHWPPLIFTFFLIIYCQNFLLFTQTIIKIFGLNCFFRPLSPNEGSHVLQNID